MHTRGEDLCGTFVSSFGVGGMRRGNKNVGDMGV